VSLNVDEDKKYALLNQSARLLVLIDHLIILHDRLFPTKTIKDSLTSLSSCKNLIQIDTRREIFHGFSWEEPITKNNEMINQDKLSRRLM
jgi:hypothetical protein